MMDSKVDRDVREAAAKLVSIFNQPDAWQEKAVLAILSGNWDSVQLLTTLQRMKEAGRQAGLREAAEAMREAIARGYDAPEVKCAHDRYGWEDCINCYDDALENAITALIEPAPCPPPTASS